ncbi:phage antirepressor [Bombilactobacillus bombi]|uniref:Phage antirepressor n=1 Tax=Bombilactobacillus bombi TaxID=1303590 RepID=A0A3R6YRF0_9LACO|nr:phage antirepressor [Bombilactobacillus bombi]RHW49701.1 phage antirepressor [Bombilactobacillus bombi]
MEDVQLFKFENQNVRTILIENEPYFVGKDVAKILGYSRSADAVRAHVEADDKLSRQFTESGQRRIMTVINESGLYSLILSSKLPTAKKFKHWVTKDVLPAIRKHGGYLTNQKIEEALLNPDTIINLAQQLKQERETRLLAQQEADELRPKATYCDLILQNKSLLSVSKISKDYGMSAIKFNRLLHELGIQYQQGKVWLLYSKYDDKGYTQTSTFPLDDEHSKITTKWTQRGRLFLYNFLKEKEILPMIEQRQLEGV